MTKCLAILICLLCAPAWGQGWLLVQPPVDRPAITFMDGTGQQAPGVLTSFSMLRITDDQGTITGATVTCISPDMGRVWIAPLHHVGNDLLVSTCHYSDGTTVVYTNALTGAGFEIVSLSGVNPIVYGVKGAMTDPQWFMETNAAPAFGYFDAGVQFFQLGTNAPNNDLNLIAFHNSLATEQPLDTNTDETASAPPMP